MASRNDGSGHRSSPARHLPAGLRRGLVLVGLAATLVVSGLPASADAPETGTDPGVTLTVTPSDTVSDGQMVTVTGNGFPPNAAGLLRQCAGTAAAPECDTFVSSIFIVSPDGSIPPVYLTAQRVITTWTTTYNCSTQSCGVFATAGGRSSWHHIHIAGAGTVVPSSTSPSTSPTTSPTSTVSTVTTPTTIPSATTTTTAPLAGSNIICDILQALRGILGGLLAGVVDGLLPFFGCPPAA